MRLQNVGVDRSTQMRGIVMALAVLALLGAGIPGHVSAANTGAALTTRGKASSCGPIAAVTKGFLARITVTYTLEDQGVQGPDKIVVSIQRHAEYTVAVDHNAGWTGHPSWQSTGAPTGTASLADVTTISGLDGSVPQTSKSSGNGGRMVASAIFIPDLATCTYEIKGNVGLMEVTNTRPDGTTFTGSANIGQFRIAHLSLPRNSATVSGSRTVPATSGPAELKDAALQPGGSYGSGGLGNIRPKDQGSAQVSWQLTPLSSCSGELSGPAWRARFLDSKSTADLAVPFRTNVDRFRAALHAAHAHVSIGTTYRPKERGYLMHFAWLVSGAHRDAKKKAVVYGGTGLDPAKVPSYAGVSICWDHGNASESKSAAQQMVQAYHIAYPPAWPSSRHFDRQAIDMTITWSGTLHIKNASGQTVTISTGPRTGDENSQLWAVGKTYGVIKLQKDPPHWSVDGR